MSQLMTRQGILPLLLIGLLTALFFLGRSIDAGLHQSILQSSHELSEADAVLNQNILKTRSGLNLNYDQLNAGVNKLRKNSQHLRDALGQVFLDKTNGVFENLDALDGNIDQKEQLIEEFKSKNAILNNSLMYFSLASRRLAKKLNQMSASKELIFAFSMLSMEITRYTRNPSPKIAQILEGLINSISVSELGVTTGDELEQLIRHGKLVIELAGEVNRTTVGATQLNIADSAYHSMEHYLRFHKSREEHAKKFRILSYVASILLILFLINLFVRLRWSAKALARSNADLTKEKERVETTLESIGDGVIKTSARGIVEYINPVAEVLTGWDRNAALGQHLTEIFTTLTQNTRQVAASPLLACFATRKIVQEEKELVLVSKTGAEHIVKINTAPILGEGKNIEGAVMVFHDMSETQRLIEHISHQAKHDALTGLVNRREFESRLEAALLNTREEQSTHALCYLDLDQFKIVNDTCGHIAGDELLKELSRVLENAIRDSDTIARLGGDEFGVLLWNCSPKNAEYAAEHMLKAVKEYRFAWKERIFEIGSSIGVVPITADNQDITELLSHADVACYAAKDSGRNRVHFYEEADQELTRRHRELHWAASITEALDKNRFHLYFQPIVSIKEQQADTVKCEILVRLITDEGEEISPGAFIPAAERFSLMGAIDKWVIENALRNLSSFQAGYDKKTLQFCINLSGNSINDPALLEFIQAMLRQHPIASGSLCFEITETAAISNLNQAMTLITTLQDLGVQFALDDFGSGLSSFAYLKTLPVNYLKIDGSFVKNMVNDPIDRAMVDTINRVGQVMGMQTVAEFVENEAILAMLEELDVDFAQGYGVAKPQPIEQLVDIYLEVVNG